MGFYIETPYAHEKADYLINNVGDTFEIDQPEWGDLEAWRQGYGLICVVDNGIFEAAAYVFDKDELNTFTEPSDKRPKRWLLMPKWAAEGMSGYSRSKKTDGGN